MNRFLHGVAQAMTETFDLADPVLEVGSYQVPGQEDIADLRSLFLGQNYLGIDIRPGAGVDQVADVEKLPFADGAFGTVVAMNTFEHVRCFWRGFDEIFRVLRPDGALLLSCPFYFHIHDYPSDYWRFTPKALEVLLERYPQRILGWNGPARKPASVWAIAFREDYPAIEPGQYERFRDNVRRQAREPLRLSRKLRYRLGRWLCGRGPFAPYLDLERWETEWQTSSLR